MSLLTRREPSVPLCLSLLPLAASPAHVLANDWRDEERLVDWPVEALLGEAGLLLSERRTMNLEGVLFVRRSVAEMRSNQDERRPLLFATRFVERPLDRVEVIPVLHD